MTPPYQCTECNKRLRQRDRRYHPYVGSSDFLCQTCYNKSRPPPSTSRTVLQQLNQLQINRPNRQIPTNPPSIPPNPPPIPQNPNQQPVPLPQPSQPHLSLMTVPKSESECCVCHDKLGRDRISQTISLQVWRETKIVIPQGNRICSNHIDPNINLLDANSLAALITQAKIGIVPQDCFMLLLDSLSSPTPEPPKESPKIHFEDDLYTDQQCKHLTGLSKPDFENLAAQCKDHLVSLKLTGFRTCVGIFMTWMRLGVSQEVLCSMFGFSQQYISRIIHLVRKCLTETFVPLHLGYDHMTRNDFIQNHSTELAKQLCEGGPTAAICIADGTYLYIQRSANYELQKQTYSMQKKRWLVKPMMIVSTSGYILEVEGLYLANGGNNDASIMNSMLMNPEGFQSFFEDGDVLILDRGFRDSVAFAEAFGLLVKTPKFLPRGQRQFSTLDANESRAVTKHRWVVEAVNSRLKCWNFFKNVIPNTYLPILQELTRIICAIINAYSPPIQTDKPEHASMIQSIQTRVGLVNLLKDSIISAGIDKQRVCWIPLDGHDLVDFPILSMDDLQTLTLGVYQIKQAPSYVAQHMDQGAYSMFYHIQTPTRLRVKIESRHTSKLYQLWIDYKPKDNGPTSISGWYCQCKVGSRTLGMCAHVTSVLWFLGFARHEDRIHRPAEHIGDQLIDAATECYY